MDAMARYATAIGEYALEPGFFDENTPPGFRIVEIGDRVAADEPCRWCIVEDDNAPAEFDGAKVDLTFCLRVGDDSSRIVEVADRRVIER